ncbi:MAG: hypothetical protein V3T41_02400 [bacterium]
MRPLVGILTALALAGAAWPGGKEAFIDYYATASSLISSLNNAAADLERLNLQSGDFSDDVASDIKSRLVKAREGFNSILTYGDHTNELNEGYVLYIDKMLLALMIAKEYREKGEPERRDRLVKIMAEAGGLRTELNDKVQRDKKKWGLD